MELSDAERFPTRRFRLGFKFRLQHLRLHQTGIEAQWVEGEAFFGSKTSRKEGASRRSIRYQEERASIGTGSLKL